MKQPRFIFWSICTVLMLAGPVVAQETLVSKRIVAEIPLDPLSTVWAQAPPLDVPLAGQMITTPMHLNPSVKALTLKSLHTGTEIAFLFAWEDPTENRFMSIGEFSDAVAVQIPYLPSAEVPYIMGGPGKRVLILHWTAFRQENIDNGYFDTAKAQPNYTYDWYPHADPPYTYPRDWHNPYALNYIGGEKVLRKNTVKSPVREVVAEGFGSSTWKDIQGAEGRGVYKDGKWHVVIKRRFVEENTSNPEWSPGRATFVTFAVWDGGNGERGARKALRHGWIPLQIEER